MVCSPGSQRSRSVSSHHSRGTGRSASRGQSRDRSYSRSERSNSRSRSFSERSRSRSRSRSHFRSRSTSKGRSVYSRSRSNSWSRSRSRSRDHSTYTSRSRSVSRSSSRSGYRPGRRRSYFRSRSRSHTYESRSRSRTRSSHHSSPDRKGSGKDPRDRSKRVKWTNNVWVVGERTKDSVFHFCDICDLPIVIYGRLLPCKHVLCYTCAMNLPNKCSRCQKSIQTVERCLVGGIFMCFENEGCRRTYLSQRDLQAHIDHRHKPSTNAAATSMASSGTGSTTGSLVVGSTAKIPTTVNENKKLDNPGLLGNAKPTNEDHLFIKTTTNSSLVGSTNNPTSSRPNIKVSNGSPTILPSISNPSGLLPLPTQPAQPSTRIPVGVSCPMIPSNPNFPQLTQFSNPPPMTNTTIPPPNFMSNVPPIAPAVSQGLTNASAVAALAAVVSATMNAQQSNAANSLNSRSTGSFQQTTLSSNALQQPNQLNVSLIPSALRAPSPKWVTTTSNVSNALNLASLASQSKNDINLTNPNNRRLPFL